MKVLLIQPNPNHMIHAAVPKYVNQRSGQYPPLGLMYLASSLISKTSAEVKILDADMEKSTHSQIKKVIASFAPQVVGLTATSFTIFDAIETAKMVKSCNPNIHVCLGGPHATIYPAQSLNFQAIDSVVMGEGEETFSELINQLEKRGNLSEIPGLVFRSGESRLVTNRQRPPIPVLDTLPVPARHLQDRLPAMFLDNDCSCYRRVAHYRTLIISDVESINLILEQINMMDHSLKVSAFRRADLRGHYEFTRIENFFQRLGHYS